MDTNRFTLLRQAQSARTHDYVSFEQQRRRLAEMVAFARAHSPFYRDLYRDLPVEITDLTLLPITQKQGLMNRFNDWSTDRAVTYEQVSAVADTPERIGERFLGRYAVVTTSGTTGTRGLFLLDEGALAVTSILAFRMLSDWLNWRERVRTVLSGGRLAMVFATGGHFASAVAAARLRNGSNWGRSKVEVFPVHLPMWELVDRLNRFRPSIVTGYATTVSLLADEQQAGRLDIHPVFVTVTAEGLSLPEYQRIAKVFHAKVRNSYAATECPFLSYGCRYGWLHVNSDWVIVEPVDSAYRPIRPGEQSHSVLITNLANRVQPILRYDLGDRVLQRPDPCPCGNPLPAIRVEGRASDLLTFSRPGAAPVTLTPLTLTALIDRRRGTALAQFIQTSPTSLHVRLQPADGVDPDQVWQTVYGELSHLLSAHDLGHVAIERASEPPEQATGGKYRRVIPLG